MCNTTPHTGYFPIPPIPLKESNEIVLDRLDSFRGDIPMKLAKICLNYSANEKVIRMKPMSFFKSMGFLLSLGDVRVLRSPLLVTCNSLAISHFLLLTNTRR